MSNDAFKKDIIKIHEQLINDENRLNFELCSGKNKRFFYTRHMLASGLYIYVFADMEKSYPDIQIELNTKTNTSDTLADTLNSLVSNGNALAQLGKLDEIWHLSVDGNNTNIVFRAPSGSESPVGGSFGKCIQLAKYPANKVTTNNACHVVKELLSLIGVIKRNEVLVDVQE